MRALKMVDKKTEGEYEIIKNHIKECKINGHVFVEVANEMGVFDMESDEAYFKGICFGLDGELSYIDVDKFVQAVNEYLSEDDVENDPIYMVELIDSLNGFTGYTLYL